MKKGIETFNQIKTSLFWRTYLLNLFLILSVLLICFLSASALEEKVLHYLLLFLFPTMILIGIYTHRMIRPIQQLHKAVDDVTRGNYEHFIPIHPNTSKTGILSERFNEIIDHLRQSREGVKKSNQELLDQRKFLRQVIDKSPNYIFARDGEGNYTLVNQTLAQLFGVTPEVMIGKNVRDFHSEELSSAYLQQEREVMESLKELFIPEGYYLDNNGNGHWLQVTKLPILSTDGQSHEVLTISTDITALKQREKQMEHLAYHDTLTGLPNRTYFHEKLTEFLSEDKEGKSSIAILFLDLDGFKHINDTLGHLKGDLLLKEVTHRLRECIALPHFIARLGGDEFTVLITEWEYEEQVDEQASMLIDVFKRPFHIGEQEFHLTTSVGISLYPMDGQDMETVIKNADTAMYQAKKRGKNTYVFYTPDMSYESWGRLVIGNYLRKALECEEFHLVYQPKKDLKTGELTGMEALLRWENPHLGSVPPDKFIPIAEETGLIIPIGMWVLLRACGQNKIWQEQGYPPMRIAVNLSAKQLLDIHLFEKIHNVLIETGLDPTWLELEITESTLMGNADSVSSMLHDFKKMGIQLAIDDFGTGYSSLSYLKRFPVNTIKIDRSFIQDITRDEEDQAITRAILAMSTSLKLKVIAEGVETAEQTAYLKELGCHEIQGYVLSRPLTAEQFTTFLSTAKRRN